MPMADLPRLKPDPVPDIHPVAEFAVSGARAAVYERTKTGLGVPWMGVVAMAFAHCPRIYDTLWSAMEPITGTRAFDQACQSVRDVAEREAGAMAPAPLVPRLSAQGYDVQEIDDIRACNEVFSSGNMPDILMATLARYLLEENTWQGGGDLDSVTAPCPSFPRPPPDGGASRLGRSGGPLRRPSRGARAAFRQHRLSRLCPLAQLFRDGLEGT